MALLPLQSVDGVVPARLLGELWRESEAEACGLSTFELGEILSRIHHRRDSSSPMDIASFRALRLSDLVLAQACALGKEQAWERFLTLYRAPLQRAAIAIAGSETRGRDLADALYAELYGLTSRDGQRRSPLDSYAGRGSLIGWLRTTLAQRHVDYHRRTHREMPLGDFDAPAPPEPLEPHPEARISALGAALAEAIQQQDAEDRFLLSAYFLDERTLLQIARMLHVHEATVSRRLRRATDHLRKQVIRALERGGMSRRAVQETLGTDPRDLDLNLKQMLQDSQQEIETGTFLEQGQKEAGR